MEQAPRRRAFLLGLRDVVPFALVVVPFGLMFGVAASEAGWNLAQILGMSVFVVAGASQFTALQLLSDQAPLLIVIVTSLAVNLRLAMYSASIAPLVGAAPFWQRALAGYVLTDQTYGTTISNATLRPPMSVDERMWHLFGSAVAICPLWYAASLAGALVGAAIPPALALDFAVPVTFIALVAPMLRGLPHLAAAFVSVAVSLALAWMPYNLWLLIAALLAMLTGAGVELLLERRR
ncbi:AzlC family ABC transporter permease [uncultured Amaricoccus sp.]|uniref:AzlC family ABC transporter permease n=1 Tax=uncultured Amaricoccus sp. TaxID=339341 RepID=UPI00262FD320|nr:AzlC family ABC transporter permease [uncultured Amaricoccus sp.]